MPRDCRKLLFGLPWIFCVFATGCQLLTGASERRLVPSEDGCDDAGQCASCQPGQSRCDGSFRKTCFGGAYQDDLCPRTAPYCSGAGACVACIDSSDDRNPCTRDECIEGMPSHTRASDGTTCPGGACTLGVCVGPCNNGFQDGLETSIDCGGNCLACDDDKPCKRAEDCQSGFCSFCTDLATCQTCSSDCSDATCGTPPILIYNTECFAALLLRNGAVVESQSSEGLCENERRRMRPRPGDVSFLYVRNLFYQALVAGTSPDYPPQNRSGRCVGAFRTRAELLQEINRSAAWTEVGTVYPIMSMACEVAALYRWQS